MDKVDHSFIPATKEKWYRYSGKQLKISYKTIYSIIIWHRNDNLGHLCQRNENIGSLTNPGELSSVQFSCSVVSDSLWPYELQHVSPPWPSPTTGVYSNSRPSSRWCHPAISSSVIPFSSCLQSFDIRVFSNESTLCMRWPKYWSFNFSIIPSKEHPGLISFRMDWLDLLAVQGTLKSLLQHHSSKASVLCAQVSL